MKKLNYSKDISITYYHHGNDRHPHLKNMRDLYELLRPEWSDIEKTQEYFVLMLNKYLQIIFSCKLETSGVEKVIEYPETLITALPYYRPYGIILAQNYPPAGNGCLMQEFTDRMSRAARQLELIVIDHLIAFQPDCYAALSEGASYKTSVIKRIFLSICNGKKHNGLSNRPGIGGIEYKPEN